jgi:hypothetical protein
MSPGLSSVLRASLLACLAAPLAACAAPREPAVPACPYCGDPVTRVGADGRAEVVPRVRIASWAPAAAAAPAPQAAR